jgi:hypothetical protein
MKAGVPRVRRVIGQCEVAQVRCVLMVICQCGALESANAASRRQYTEDQGVE